MKPIDPYAKGSPRPTTKASLGKVTRAMQAPQDPEDRHGPGYDNDHPNDWVRGANEDATRKPNFDRGPSGNRYSKGK